MDWAVFSSQAMSYSTGLALLQGISVTSLAPLPRLMNATCFST